MINVRNTSVVVWCVDDCVAGEVEGWSLRDGQRIWVKGQEASAFVFKYTTESAQSSKQVNHVLAIQ